MTGTSGRMDWIDSKRAKSLRVSNDRETFQLKKIRRSLDSMKIMNDNLLKQEERKVKKWLRKQAEISSPGFRTLYKPLSSYPASSVDQTTTTDTRPVSGKDSCDIPWSQYGDHLPNFVSFLRLPTKRSSDDRKHSKDLTPFSGTDLTMQTLSSRIPNGPRNSTYAACPPNRDFQKGSNTRHPSLDSSISMHEAVALFPSLQRLSMKGERLSLSSPYNSVSGLPALQKKLKNMLGKARDDGKYRPLRSLPEVKPEEILSCRYLRLSQNNINTLLELCKESGVQVDLHPHMKESDIDASTILSTSPSKSI